MIKVNFFLKFDSSSIHTDYQEFNDLDSFLKYYLNNDNLLSTYEVIEGHEIITGEIKQKGINNK